MTAIYCVKCRQKTSTTGEHHATAKNGKGMIQGQCTACGTKKTTFGSGVGAVAKTKGKKKGKGLMDIIVNLF